MRAIKNITLQTKVMLLLLLIAMGIIVAVAAVAWISARSILTDDAVEHMANVRQSRVTEIERYFRTLRDQVTLLTNDETVVEAMAAFSADFAALENAPISAEWDAALNRFYESEFLPNLEINLRQQLSASAFRQEGNAATHLQYYYLANNRNPVGKKALLDKANDGSSYSETHARYHPFLRTFLDLFGYHDLLLIDPDTRNIVYSTSKEVDFATNLQSGPYADSGLGDVVDRILRNPEQGRIRITDFLPYDPSFQAPSAFLGVPLYAESELIGVLVIQMPVDTIDAVMTSNQNWAGSGMGTTGETYLVGADYRMRSTSRYLIENKVDYLRALRNTGVDAITLGLIANLDTSILQQAVETESVDLALAGQTGSHVITNFRNVPILSAYAPLEIEGLDWVLLAEMDVSEITQPILDQQDFFVRTASILSLLLIILGTFFAWLLIRPMRRLVKGAQKLGLGDLNVTVPVSAKDEVGLLATAFNRIGDNLRLQHHIVEQKSRENERLLFSILPEPIAARVKRGELKIAEQVQNVSFLFTSVHGIHALETRIGNPRQVAELLNELSIHLDAAAAERGIDRQPTVTNHYMFVSGLHYALADNVERIVSFALVMRAIIKEFNTQYGTQLVTQIGIHTGDVLTAVSGSQKYRFDLWGTTISIGNAIESAAQPDTILVSHEIYTQMRHAYNFEPHEPIRLEDEQIWRVWQLIPPVAESSTEMLVDNFSEMLSAIGASESLPDSLKPRNRRLRRRFAKS
jgi:class 3 adenylate cyclase